MQIDLVEQPSRPLVDGLADVLLECVRNGASVGFLADISVGEARRWWSRALEDGDTLTWVARDSDERVVGTVRLLLASQPNGTHRAEVSKLLVHPEARGRGVASALLAAIEEAAARRGRTLLVLDTQTGSVAEGIYRRMGWATVGVIDEFAATPAGTLAPTTIMTKRLAPR
jgi:acetyltransferase